MLNFKKDQAKVSNRAEFSEVRQLYNCTINTAHIRDFNGALRRHTGPLNFGYCIIGHKRKLINTFVQIEFHLHVRSME